MCICRTVHERPKDFSKELHRRVVVLVISLNVIEFYDSFQCMICMRKFICEAKVISACSCRYAAQFLVRQVFN